MKDWKDSLIEIRNIEEKYGSSLRDSASDREIKKLIDNVELNFGNIEMPQPYIEFLKKINGLDFNGLVIYGVDKFLLDKEEDEDLQGFIETNNLWYENEWQKRYVFFGDSDTAWYCYDHEESVYAELDKPSGTFMQSFESFDAMLDYALETAL